MEESFKVPKYNSKIWQDSNQQLKKLKSRTFLTIGSNESYYIT